MTRFTTSERRGTIALMVIMAVVVALLAVGRGVHSGVPEARDLPAQADRPTAIADTAGSKPAKKHRSDSAKSARKARGGGKRKTSKQATRYDEGRRRSPLDEPVDGSR